MGCSRLWLFGYAESHCYCLRLGFANLSAIVHQGKIVVVFFLRNKLWYALLQYLRSSRFLGELFFFYGGQVASDLVFQGIYLNLDLADGFLMRGHFRAMGLYLCFRRNRAKRGFIDR